MTIKLATLKRPKARIRLGEKPKSEPPEYMTTAEAAVFLRISEPTLRKLVKEGTIHCARLGRRMLFSRRKLVAYLDGDS